MGKLTRGGKITEEIFELKKLRRKEEVGGSYIFSCIKIRKKGVELRKRERQGCHSPITH